MKNCSVNAFFLFFFGQLRYNIGLGKQTGGSDQVNANSCHEARSAPTPHLVASSGFDSASNVDFRIVFISIRGVRILNRTSSRKFFCIQTLEKFLQTNSDVLAYLSNINSYQATLLLCLIRKRQL